MLNWMLCKIGFHRWKIRTIITAPSRIEGLNTEIKIPICESCGYYDWR